MFKRNGLLFNIDVQQEIDGITFPPGFFKDAYMRSVYGITEEPDPVRKNEKFFFVNQNNDGSLTQTAKSKDMILSILWNEIKQYRDNLSVTGGYKVGTKWYHSDIFSRSQQIGLVLLGANIPSGLQWKTMDGSFESMTQTLAGQIFAAAAVQDQAIFAKAEYHKAQLELLNTAEELEAYDWKSGWPEVYSEPT